MHRDPLLRQLEAYLDRYPGERVCVDRVRELVQSRPDCFERTCLPGHITGSAWILSADQRCVLLTHHRKLERWLQLGGHADGQTDVLQVALREAQEESGLSRFTVFPATQPAAPFDIDVHLIPARGDEPAHWHHDVRFLLVAEAGQELRISDESHDLCWIERSRLLDFTSEESILRMERKAHTILRAPALLGSQ